MNIKNYDSNNKLDFADMQPIPDEERKMIFEKVEEDCKSSLYDVEVEFDDYLDMINVNKKELAEILKNFPGKPTSTFIDKYYNDYVSYCEKNNYKVGIPCFAEI